MLRFVLVVTTLLFSANALAQQAPQAPPPRNPKETIDALQAVLTLREAELRDVGKDIAALQSGYEARLATAMEWLRAAQDQHPPTASK